MKKLTLCCAALLLSAPLLWIRTRKVMIEQYAVPHSHPVLTLNTRGDDDELLSTFIHEQITPRSSLTR